jgi:L-alanine-DL-glutamate epimerase-like enolase superfamily enzyme
VPSSNEALADLLADRRSLHLRRPWGTDVQRLHLITTEVRTRDGRVGHGFSWTPSVGAAAILALLQEDCRSFVRGRPASPEAMWDQLWWHLHEAGSGGITTLALAGVDLALWDLAGQDRSLPLVSLLGRRRDFVPTYGSGVNLHYSLVELTEQARRWVEAGHHAVKVKVGKEDLAEDVERVATVREVIGPHRKLMIDANQRWDLPRARRAIAALARFDLHWVEEPLLSDDLAAHAELRRLIDVPIAIGENLRTVHEFRSALVERACDFIQPNVVRVGGITPFLRIAGLARAHGVPVYPHLLPEISGQLALCLPEETMVEDVEDSSFAALGVLTVPNGIDLSGARFRADTASGHGLRFVPKEEEEK